jgi:uncharacterized protein (DUF1778 family)
MMSEKRRPSEASEARLSLRLDPAHKALIDRAAAYSGETVTSFATATLVRRARKVLREHEVTLLSERDWNAFMDALDNPPEPNEALRRAARSHRELIVDRACPGREGEPE